MQTFPWGSQPHLILAEQKDEEVIKRLEHQVSQFLDSTSISRYVSVLGPEIRLLTRFAYYSQTVILPRRESCGGAHAAVTIGEEYCDLRTVSVATSQPRERNVMVPLKRGHVTMSVLLRVLLAYCRERYSVGWHTLARIAQVRNPRLFTLVSTLRSIATQLSSVAAASERACAKALRIVFGMTIEQSRGFVEQVSWCTICNG